MNDGEWAVLAEQLDQGFKGEFDDTKERVYRRHLAGLGFDRVQAGIDYLARTRQVFLPTLGELAAAADAAARPPAPTFDEAWAAVRPALSDGRMAIERLVAACAAEEVVAWVQSYGGPRMGQEPVDDPEWGGATVARLRQSYEQFLERAAHRRALGLPIIEEGVAAARGLRRPDFAGVALGAPPSALPPGVGA